MSFEQSIGWLNYLPRFLSPCILSACCVVARRMQNKKTEDCRVVQPMNQSIDRQNIISANYIYFRNLVRLGEWDLNTPKDCPPKKGCNDHPLDVGIEKIIVHENYLDGNEIQKKNDIALLKLKQKVEYTGTTTIK